jgi:hypothetical protein
MLAEKYKIVPIMNTADFTTGLNSDSINMKNYHKATILVSLGAVAGAGLVLQVFSGLTDGARTTALAFKYAHGSAAIGSALCDVLADWTTAPTTGWAIGDASHDNYFAVIEIDAAEMTGNWLTVYPNAGTSGIAHMIAVLEPRYENNQAPTALT